MADKPNWQTVVEPYAPTKEWAEGDELIGTYKSVREIEQDSIDGGKRMVKVYEIVDDNSDTWSVWGTYSIDEAFEKIVPGQYVRITFLGKIPIKDGRQSINQFKVDVAQ